MQRQWVFASSSRRRFLCPFARGCEGPRLCKQSLRPARAFLGLRPSVLLADPRTASTNSGSGAPRAADCSLVRLAGRREAPLTAFGCREGVLLSHAASPLCLSLQRFSTPLAAVAAGGRTTPTRRARHVGGAAAGQAPGRGAARGALGPHPAWHKVIKTRAHLEGGIRASGVLPNTWRERLEGSLTQLDGLSE